MSDIPEEQLVLKGPALTVAYAVDANGDMPAKEFLDEMTGKKAPTDREKAGLYQVFKVLTQIGKVTNELQFKKERDEIFGFKKYQARIAAFRVDDIWYLTHGFKKKKDRWSETEFTRANRIRNEHLKRCSKGQH